MLPDELAAVATERANSRLAAADLHRRTKASKAPARSAVAGSLRRLADAIEPGTDGERRTAPA